MAIARRLRSAFLALLAVVGILLWFIALLLFTRVTENSVSSAIPTPLTFTARLDGFSRLP